jgi:hypothetical protein
MTNEGLARLFSSACPAVAVAVADKLRVGWFVLVV